MRALFKARTRPIAATSALVALGLLGGCGGSAIEEASEPLATTVEAGADIADQAATAVPGAVERPADDSNRGAIPPGKSSDNKQVATGDRPATAQQASGGNPGSPTVDGASAVERLVATAPMFGGDAPCKPATLSDVNIGNVSTLSGVLGELFSPVIPALNTFVAAQNSCGGLNGHRIKFFVDDDQGDPSTAATKVQDMIQNKRVLAFVGNIQVLTIDAVVPVIKRTGIPIIGSDLTNSTWFTNPLLFPQGAPQHSVPYGYLLGATEYHKKTKVGNIWCIEVPRACEQANRALKELAPKLGATIVRDIQVSITAPSYVQQCLEFKNAGAEALALTIDAATMNRLARSCTQVGYFPKVMPHPLGVGNEKQFLGNKWLGDSYVSLGTFPWMGNSTPAEKYWHAMIKKFNPGFSNGNAASLGWTSGALLLAASAGLSETNPTTQQLLDTLYTFKGQKFTELGGLTGPRTFGEGANPRVPYCLFAAVSNAGNTGWKVVQSKPTCSSVIAPSDPQNGS